jgi:hypothetical protein
LINISQGSDAPQAHPDNVRRDHAGRVNFEQRNVHRSKDMKDPNEYSVLVEAYPDFFEILRIAVSFLLLLEKFFIMNTIAKGVSP